MHPSDPSQNRRSSITQSLAGKIADTLDHTLNPDFVQVQRKNQREMTRALSHQISSQPWSPDFEQDVRGMIASNVEPAVRDLKRRLHDERTGLGFQLIESAIKAAPIPLVLTFAAGRPQLRKGHQPAAGAQLQG